MMTTDERLKAFGKKLSLVRKDLKVTQKQACKDMGIDFRNYQLIEKGRGTNVRTLLKIADYYGIDLGALNE